MDVDPILLSVGDDLDPGRLGGGLVGDDGQRGDRDQPAARGIGQGLGRHQPDPQAGVAARPLTDEDGSEIGRPPALLGQQSLNGRRQVAGMTALFVEGLFRS